MTDLPPTELCDAYENVEDYLQINSQTKLRSFLGVECVRAGVSISHGPDDDLVDDLSPLSSLRVIVGPLTVINSVLADLSGLEAVEWVGGDLNIGAILPDGGGCSENPNLENLDALAGLQHFDNLLICGASNDSLVSIDGLDAALEGDLGGQVSLGGLSQLPSIAPFEGVTSVQGIFVLGGLPMLADLSPLHDLTGVAALSIDSTAVVDLIGLEALTVVEYRLSIMSNPNLATLAGLDALVSANEVFIVNNPLLPQSEAEAFAATVDVPGQVLICGNLDGPEC